MSDDVIVHAIREDGSEFTHIEFAAMLLGSDVWVVPGIWQGTGVTWTWLAHQRKEYRHPSEAVRRGYGNIAHKRFAQWDGTVATLIQRGTLEKGMRRK